MEKKDAEQPDLKKMIADYMEGGLLDNIIDMFALAESVLCKGQIVAYGENHRIGMLFNLLVEFPFRIRAHPGVKADNDVKYFLLARII